VGGRHARHLGSMTSYQKSDQSIRIYFEEQSCQISSRSDLKRWSLGLFGQIDKQAQEEQEQEECIELIHASIIRSMYRRLGLGVTPACPVIGHLTGKSFSDSLQRNKSNRA